MHHSRLVHVIAGSPCSSEESWPNHQHRWGPKAGQGRGSERASAKPNDEGLVMLNKTTPGPHRKLLIIMSGSRTRRVHAAKPTSS